MSQSPARSARLRVARQLPAAHCPGCGVALERVAVITTHLERCDRYLAAEEARIDALLGSAT